MNYRPWLLFFVCSPSLVPGGPSITGEPWYMQETAMSSDARLTFMGKSWWKRAQELKEGNSFTLDLNRDNRPDTLIERRDGNIIEVVDDSGKSGDLANTKSSAAYLVSLKGSGLVDRMIVYIDNDHDGKADEMEIRHYQDGYLRYAWFGENYDGDGAQIFALKNWSYAGGSDFSSKFRGNVSIYLNKYDPLSKTWVPLSECPFLFWDQNHDGHSDIVLRVSAAPLSSNTGKDPDYANNYNYMWAPRATPLPETGNMNVRFSYNVDPDPRGEPVQHPHFTFGFNMVGAQAYSYPEMRYTNPLRREPRTVVRLPASQGVSAALRYPAQQTGFTWDEARTVFRWEGQFWIYQREYMPNTGGPTERWNMRREFSETPSSERKLYYSAIDKRYHLLGAREGWIEVGDLVNKQKDLEFRFFDSDHDGYFDTTEVFQPSNPVPVRVSRVNDPLATPVKLDRQWLQADYNNRVLPSAIRENERLIEALQTLTSDSLAAQYQAEAMKSDRLERRRYCLDIARELYFLKARDALYARNAAGPYPRLEAAARSQRILDRGPIDGGFTLGDSLDFWSTARQIEAFVETYNLGRYEKAAALIETITGTPPR